MWLPTGFTKRTELVISRSRFLTVLARTDSEEEARAAIAAERSLYPDARHHCSAFIVDVPSAQAVERSSDDGEPSGTAGMPMLDVLKGSGLTNVTAVVVRYFGGIKLGTGGLVRAYSGAVAGALDGVPRVEGVTRPLLTLPLAHAEAGRVMAELVTRGVEVVGTEYGANAVLTLVDDGDLAAVVAHVTRGEGVLTAAGERTTEVPAHT